MTIAPTSVGSPGGAPVSIARTGVPPGVLAGTPAARQAYASAEAFEQMLVGELSQSLVQGSGLEGEGGSEAGGGGTNGGEGAGGGDPLLSALVPQALSESVMRGGGLGLAGPLAAALDPAAAQRATTTSPTGGAAA